MRKPNYSFEKRQRDLAKQKKREAKRVQKQEQKTDADPADQPEQEGLAAEVDRADQGVQPGSSD